MLNSVYIVIYRNLDVLRARGVGTKKSLQVTRGRNLEPFSFYMSSVHAGNVH